MRNGEITGLVLAGGQGRRMGGVDKGLAVLRGKHLVEHVLARLAPQVDELLISANRNVEAYARLGYPVLQDDISGYAGPLAGLHAGLARSATPLLATAPCDSPYLPQDLVQRLHEALTAAGARIAVASTCGRQQPVFMLCHRDVLADLNAFLAAGGRKIDAWYACLPVVDVPFDDEAEAFANINTSDELATFGKGIPAA